MKYKIIHYDAVTITQLKYDLKLNIMSSKIKKVVCAISGGIDSCIAALLLKKQGYNVHGVFMRNWDIADEKGYCQADVDRADAEYICRKIGIPFSEVNFVKEYWNNVFSSFIQDYNNGLTPNPDILCNKLIKFDAFLKYAQNNLEADAIATGHYARIIRDSGTKRYRLFKGVDCQKDQTFFLAQIPRSALEKCIFPLGEMTKKEVKKIAAAAGFGRILHKKESMGICFIGRRKFQDFIDEYIEPKPGNFINIENNQVVGQHKGVHCWTVGQRCMIGGQPFAYYVVERNCLNQEIYVVCEKHFRKEDILREVEFFNKKAGKLLKSPLLNPRLKEGAIPEILSPDCPYLQPTAVIARESPDRKRRKLEDSHLKKALEDSFNTKQQYEAAVHFSSLQELHMCLQRQKIDEFWSICFKTDCMLIMHISQGIPEVICSILVNKDLNVTLSYRKVFLQELGKSSLGKNIVISPSDIVNAQSDMPILTYVSGYAVHTILKKLRCEQCNISLVCDRSLDVTANNEWISKLDRGGLKYPHPDAVCITLFTYAVVKKLISADYEEKFLLCQNQRCVVCNITLDMLQENDISLGIDDCDNGHDFESITKQIVWVTTNILLNNYCKRQNDLKLKEKGHHKGKNKSKQKLETLKK